MSAFRFQFCSNDGQTSNRYKTEAKAAEEGSTSVIAYELRENPLLPQNESDEEHLDMAQTEEADFQTLLFLRIQASVTIG